MSHDPLTRRQALAALGGLAIVALDAGCRPGQEAHPPTAATAEPTAMTTPQRSPRMPTVFLPHGGGPWPFMDERIFGQPGMWDHMAAYMRNLRVTPPRKPSAVLVVSAHWEEPVPTVMTAARPPMLYDYYGFPPETYELQWPAPGAPELAQRVRELLETAGIQTASDGARGFDHGTFVPLMLTWPDADVPTFQLSLQRGLDPARHFEIGQALAPLRDDGVFIVGSGMSYHNLRTLMGSMRGARTSIEGESRAFDEWLAESMLLDPTRRHTRLVEWERAPSARACHPREEHLLPLMVIAGAAAEDEATLPYRDKVMNAWISAVHFG